MRRAPERDQFPVALRLGCGAVALGYWRLGDASGHL
jgi:hypothetical protein